MRRRSRLLLVLLLVPLVLVVAAAAAGALLPRDHVAARSARYAAPAESLHAAIRDVVRYPEWRRELDRVETLDPDPVAGHPRFREVSRTGAMEVTLVRDEPSREVVLLVADADAMFGGTWTMALAPDGRGTRLTITEHGWVPNPVVRAISRYVLRHTSSMDAYLGALGTRFEERVEPEAAGGESAGATAKG